MKKSIIVAMLSLSILFLGACSEEKTNEVKEVVKTEEVNQDTIQLKGEDKERQEFILTLSEQMKEMNEDEIKEFYSGKKADLSISIVLSNIVKYALGTDDALSEYEIFLLTYTGEGYVDYTPETKKSSEDVLSNIREIVGELGNETNILTPTSIANETIVTDLGDYEYEFKNKISFMDMNDTSKLFPTYSVTAHFKLNTSVGEYQLKDIILEK